MGKDKKKDKFFATTDEASTCQLVNVRFIVRLYVGKNNEPNFKFSAYAELTTGTIVDLNCFDDEETALDWLSRFTVEHCGTIFSKIPDWKDIYETCE